MPVARHPYPFRIRLVDRFHGVRDGHRGIPQLPAETVGGVPHLQMLMTPYMLRLHQKHRAFVAGLDRTSPVPAAGVGAAKFAAAAARVAQIRGLLADWPPNPENLNDPPDDRDRYLTRSSDSVLAARRAAHRRQRTRLEAELRTAQDALARIETAGEEAANGLNDAVRARAACIDEHAAHIRERVLVYLDALVKRHPDGNELQWRSSDVAQITDLAPPPDGRAIGSSEAAPAIEEGDAPNRPDPETSDATTSDHGAFDVPDEEET